MATSNRTVTLPTLALGAGVGLATFVVGYVLTYAWRASAVAGQLRGLNLVATLFGVETVPTWKGVGWLFFGAHGVATRFPAPGGGTHLVNLVQQSNDGTVALLYVLVPVLLVLAGALAARLAEATSTGEAAGAGAAIAVGYLVGAVVGVVLFAQAIGSTGAHIAPDPITAVLLAGVIYPVVFGAVGGVVSTYVRPTARSTSAAAGR